MSIQMIFYINIAVVILLGLILLVLPIIFYCYRKKYLKNRDKDFFQN